MEKAQESRLAKRDNFQNVGPLIQLAGSDTAPVINYNIPEPTTYTGRHAIELRLSPIDEENNKIFNKDAFTSIPIDAGAAANPTIETVTEAMRNGFSDKWMFPLVRPYAGIIRLVGNEGSYQIVSNQDLSTELRNLHPQEVFSSLLVNKSLVIYRTMFGSLSYRYVEPIPGTIPMGAIINPGDPVILSEPTGLFFSLASPGNNAELTGPRSAYRVLINGGCSHIEHRPSPDDRKVQVQVGSGPWVTATLVQGPTEFEVKWFAECVINTAGPTSITVKLSGRIVREEKVIRANIKTSFSNETNTQLRPRLLLLESYRFESHLGQYGAGRIIKTFTLLPGEKTRISTRTYTRTEREAKRASSILDSVTEESTKDFENSISTEQSDKKNYQESFSYEINAKAQAVWGWGNATVSGGIKGATNSAHEEFAKNISNASEKHASTASSKRDVQINTSYEEKHIEEAETSIEREVQNINVSRTLNFVFRQMNQEHITALCLVDARVAVWDGNPDPSNSVRVEVALPELHSLLERFLVEERRKEMEEAIINELSSLFDYKGNAHNDFIEERTLLDRSGNPARTYWRVNPKLTTDYEDPITNKKEFTVQGLLVKADRHVMRTDGVMVEALLGAGNALDNYSEGLQNESIRAKELENELKEAEVRKSRLAISTVDEGPSEQVERFERVFPCCKPTIFSLWPPKEGDGKEDEKDKK
jgi:hypothetical protein